MDVKVLKAAGFRNQFFPSYFKNNFQISNAISQVLPAYCEECSI